MNSLSSMFPFTVPLTAANHQTAEKFYQQHSNSQKARQVYLNTLSVLAVNFYLTCLGMKTDFEQSQSWNPTLQVLVDSADLWVNDLGRLECRVVLPDAKVCVIPAQVWSDRIAYIAVQLNADLTEAALLGFVSSVETEELPIEKLQPIDQFPSYLSSLNVIAPITRLSDWLQNQIAAGWQTLEALLNGQEQLAFSFRTPIVEASQATSGMKQGKLLTLGTPKIQALFLIEIAPRTTSEYQIRIELYPTGAEAYLPRSLHLSLIDEAGKTILQAENSNSEGLEFQFAGEPGEQFSVKISLQEDTIIEAFEI
ncbi:DUF1822 family protein [Microcoleus sp. FACHB-1515]|uniref:DUF1822 family protein n=1 Tax=Cyanophyceae TaxID=3028117 RepID=UPI001686F937|nr:DUF1822 family protein [Microcoleus sp. FACHB-1515]MBD2088833.1 DUF1822 family protein [Microcoleus sp. FACHB-1515]